MARAIVVFKLSLLARLVLRRYRPKILAVTGSIGKTTTTKLVAAMLADQFRLWAQPGYNTEIGVPLAILNGELAEHGAPRGPGGWLKALWAGAGVALGRRRPYPELLVLELSADKPGDLKYLSKLAPPDVTVVTNVEPVHLENYENVEQIAAEKAEPVRALRADGLAVLNFDDTRVRMMRPLTEAAVSFYGLTDESSVWATDIKQGPAGLTANVHVREREGAKPQTFGLQTRLLGQNQLSGILAAFAVAYALGVDPKRALAAVHTIQPPPGRLTPLPGRGRAVILDDSYNSSPRAALASLEVLKDFPKPHRAVLGEMRELGAGSEDLHRLVGKSLGWLDELVAAGPTAAAMAEEAAKAGAKRVHHVAKTPDAIPLTAGWRSGTILVKGSQNRLYLERVVESLLRDPEDAAKLNQRLRDSAHADPLAKHESEVPKIPETG